MAGMQGYTEHMTTIILYSIFVMLLGSYGAYEHEFHRASMHSLYAGVSSWISAPAYACCASGRDSRRCRCSPAQRRDLLSDSACGSAAGRSSSWRAARSCRSV